MKRTVILVTVGLALVILGRWLFRSSQDPAAAANEAFLRGDYARAVNEYQRAAADTSDLGGVAHNQAAALYRLERYDDADGRYQCAAANGDALREARADYDRGNCALRQACRGDGSPDPRLLDQAAEHYRACLDRESSDAADAKLFADARHNLELTKLLQSPDAILDKTTADMPDKNDPQHLESHSERASGLKPEATESDPLKTPQKLIAKAEADDLCPH
jgi:tetratricopeptide (TPR) repeat protein